MESDNKESDDTGSGSGTESGDAGKVSGSGTT